MSGSAIKSTVAEDSPTVTLSSNNMVHHSDNKIPHHPNHEDIESKLDASPEEIITILEVIAATGNFWHDWDALKNMMSFQLKQVLAEYPQAQMTKEMQQSSLSGETYLELVNRLNEALLGFIEGPPFTVQRLCEILLNPKSTYRSLSKLTLALEKNLLVTSTLTMCTDPYPAIPTKKPPKSPQENPNEGARDGVENVNIDGDEEMIDAEADEDPTTKDTEMKEGKVEEDSSTGNSDPCTTLEQPSAATEERSSAPQAP